MYPIVPFKTNEMKYHSFRFIFDDDDDVSIYDRDEPLNHNKMDTVIIAIMSMLVGLMLGFITFKSE